MERREGFEHQRLCVVPRPLVEQALARPVTRRLMVTEAGLFPAAMIRNPSASTFQNTLARTCRASNSSTSRFR